ncbi:MAG: hypothetical protein LBE64_23680, partial [Acinetobacter pittii]|nr:hypothetical protein [Acinetobacter pittii]
PPPKRSDKKGNLIEQEGRLSLAIQAIQNGKYPSAAAAARPFEIPVSTLKARINGRESATEKLISTGIKFSTYFKQDEDKFVLH